MQIFHNRQLATHRLPIRLPEHVYEVMFCYALLYNVVYKMLEINKLTQTKRPTAINAYIAKL